MAERAMSDKPDDTGFPAQHEQFLANVEKMVRTANREIIHRHIPVFSTDDVTRLAVAVAELRARYLVAARRLIEHERGVVPDTADMVQLAKAREMFDEAVHAFEALRRAIERGYVEIKL
jgi:hypothetical protein